MDAVGRLAAGALTGLILVFAAPSAGWATTGTPPDPQFPAPGAAAPPPATAPAPPVFPPRPIMEPTAPTPIPALRAASNSAPKPAETAPVASNDPVQAADHVTYDLAPVARVLAQAARSSRVAAAMLAPPVSSVTSPGGNASPPLLNAVEIGPSVAPQPGDYVPPLMAGGLLSFAVWLGLGWRARGRRSRS